MYTLVLFGLIHLTKKGLQLKENNNMNIVRKPFTIKYFLKDTYSVPGYFFVLRRLHFGP